MAAAAVVANASSADARSVHSSIDLEGQGLGSGRGGQRYGLGDDPVKARLTGFSFHAKPQRYRERWSPTTGRLETRHRRAPALNESQETQPIVGSRPQVSRARRLAGGDSVDPRAPGKAAEGGPIAVTIRPPTTRRLQLRRDNHQRFFCCRAKLTPSPPELSSDSRVHGGDQTQQPRSVPAAVSARRGLRGEDSAGMG